MNFSLTPALEQFVRDRANSGDYNNASIAPTGCFREMAGKGKRRNIPLRRLRYAAHQSFGTDSVSFESDSK